MSIASVGKEEAAGSAHRVEILLGLLNNRLDFLTSSILRTCIFHQRHPLLVVESHHHTFDLGDIRPEFFVTPHDEDAHRVSATMAAAVTRVPLASLSKIILMAFTITVTSNEPPVCI